MVKANNKTSRKKKVMAQEFRPYRVFFLVATIAVTSFVLFLILTFSLGG